MDLMEACDVLQIRPSDDMDEIKKKYFDIIRSCHPDLAQGEDDRLSRENRAKLVNGAYDCVCLYRNQPVNSVEMFESIFSAFESVIRNYGEIVRDGNEFTIHIDSSRDDLIWRNEEEVVWSTD